MLDTTQLLLSVIGVLVTGMWWSVRAAIARLITKLDAIEARQSQMDKDCVTWGDLEGVRIDVKDHDRRLTVIETTCKQEIGKSHG